MTRTLVLIAVCFTVLIPASAARAVPPVESVTSDGGIRAWLIEDSTHPIVHLSFAVRGGAALDPQGKEGLAHMVSGLLDEGAGDLDSQAFQRRLEDLSVEMSFSAGRDRFSGSLKTLTRNLDAAAELLRLALTEPRFDAEPVERIRAQLVTDRRSSARKPRDIAFRKFLSARFPDHPYGRDRKGTEQGIAGLTTEDLRGFVSRRLARDRLAIGVYGDVSQDRLKGLLDKVFGGLPKRADTSVPAEITPEADGGITVVSRPVPQSVILFGHQGLKRSDPDYYAATVLNHILGGGSFSSRLYREVREKEGLAYSVGSRLWPMDHSALYYGSSGTANERAAQTVDIVRREWRRMRDSGPTAKEMDDAKTYLTGSFPLRFTSGSGLASTLVGMQMEDLGRDYLERRNGLIEAVTLDDVKRLARTLLAPDRLTFVVVGEPVGL